MSVQGQQVVQHGANFFVLTQINYTGGTMNSAAHVDQSAIQPVVIHMDGGTAPNVALGSVDSNFNKPINLTDGGSATTGRVMVVTYHVGAVGSVKP